MPLGLRQKGYVIFTLFIREEGRPLPVLKREIDKISRRAFQITGREEGDISLVVCDDHFICELNRKYRNRDEPTDVLSFSMQEGQEIDTSLLGDIIISLDTAKQQAEERGETLEQEFKILFVHGLLHLLGFHHSTAEEQDIVDTYTRKIVTGVSRHK